MFINDKVNKTCLVNLFETLLFDKYGFCLTLYKKIWSFPLIISLLNVRKSIDNYRNSTGKLYSLSSKNNFELRFHNLTIKSSKYPRE